MQKTGTVKLVTDGQHQWLEDKPLCGQDFRINGKPEIVTMLSTYYCICGLPAKTGWKAKAIMPGDTWELI